MIARLKGLRLYALVFAVAAVAVVVLGISASYHLDKFTVSPGGGQQAGGQAIELPYLTNGRGPEIYTFRGTLERGWFAPTRLQIIPDDQVLALEVNGRSVDLSGVSAERLKDVNAGFSLELGDYLTEQRNQIVLRVRDFGGQYGLNIRGSILDFRYLVIALCVAVLIITPMLALLRGLKVPLAHRVAYLGVITGAMVQVWNIFTYNPVFHIFSDPQRHYEQGLDLLRMDLMSLTDPIGYQLYIALLLKLTLKMPVLVAYFTSLLALVTPYVWYRFFRELQTSKTTALYGWAIVSLLPSWTAIYSYFMQETLLLPLLGASLWATWRCRRKATAASFVLMVFLWMVTGLTRGIAIPLAAIACTWLWLLQDLKFKKAGLSLVVLLLLMGPLTYRSYQTVGHFAPHGMGHLNVIYAMSGKKTIQIRSSLNGASWTHVFGSPSTGAKPFAPFSDWQTRREGTVYVNVDLSAGTRDWQKGRENLGFDLHRYLWVTAENFIFVFFSDSWPDNNMARIVDGAGSVLRWVWLPLFVAVIVLTLVYRRKLKGQWLLMALIGGWFVVQVLLPISINEGRYRKPLEGLLIAQAILLVGARRNRLRPAAQCPALRAQLAALGARVYQLTNKTDPKHD